MPTHGQTNAFIRKWNKMFAIKGYSKMSIKEKNALVEKKVNDLVKQSAEHKKIQEELKENALFAPCFFNHPRAAIAGVLGLNNFNKGEILELENFHPIYIRPSEAEIKWQEKY